MDDAHSLAERIRALGLTSGEYVVIGGGALALRGSVETKDIDILVCHQAFSRLLAAGWPLDEAYQEKWRRRLKRDGIELYPDMFWNAERRFVDTAELIASAEEAEGIPCLPLLRLKAFKSGDGTSEKDQEDVRLIDAYLRRSGWR